MKPARWGQDVKGAAHVANVRYSQASDDAMTRAREADQQSSAKQAEAVPAHSETQVTAAISLNQICQPAAERDWGTQTGAPRARTTRQKPTRLAACTVSSAPQHLADELGRGRRAEGRVPLRATLHDSRACHLRRSSSNSARCIQCMAARSGGQRGVGS
ncbi:hypothetical protein BKA63DRAFT_245795 [Paraphoma chrysanthemicola]|nr:hypothetical protein BKA63DRAFT_245795 [Paraphoma chrysanthemicola]